MAVVVTVLRKNKTNGRVAIDVQAEDIVTGLSLTNTFSADFKDATLEWLKGAVQAWIDQAKASYALADLIPTGVVDLTPAAPTPAEIARAAYKADCILMRRYVKVINAGILTNTDQGYLDTRARLLANFLPAYVDLAELLP